MIKQGAYTPRIAVDWFADPRLGTPTPLLIGRTLRYSDTDGWEVGPTGATGAWKRLAEGPKAIKAAFDRTDTSDPVEGYYELIGPKIAANPHGLKAPALVRHGDGGFDVPVDDIPRTSLYAWPAWLKKAGAQGVLWVDHSTGAPRYAVVNGQYLP